MDPYQRSRGRWRETAPRELSLQEAAASKVFDTCVYLSDKLFISRDANPFPLFRQFISRAIDLKTIQQIVFRNHGTQLPLSVWQHIFQYVEKAGIPKVSANSMGWLIPRHLVSEEPLRSNWRQRPLLPKDFPKRKETPVESSIHPIYAPWWIEEDLDFFVKWSEKQEAHRIHLHMKPLLSWEEGKAVYTKLKQSKKILIAFDETQPTQLSALQLPDEVQLSYFPQRYITKRKQTNMELFEQMTHVNVVEVIIDSYELVVQPLYLLTRLRCIRWRVDLSFCEPLAAFSHHFLWQNDEETRTIIREARESNDEYTLESRYESTPELRKDGHISLVEKDSTTHLLDTLESDRHLHSHIHDGRLTTPNILHPAAIASLLKRFGCKTLVVRGVIDGCTPKQIEKWCNMLATAELDKYGLYADSQLNTGEHQSYKLRPAMYILMVTKVQRMAIKKVDMPYWGLLHDQKKRPVVDVLPGYTNEDVAALTEFAKSTPLIFKLHGTEFGAHYQPLLELPVDSEIHTWTLTSDGLQISYPGINLANIVKAAFPAQLAGPLLDLAPFCIHLTTIDIDYTDTAHESALCELLPRFPALRCLEFLDHPRRRDVECTLQLADALTQCSYLTRFPTRLKNVAAQCLQLNRLPPSLQILCDPHTEQEGDAILQLAMRNDLSQLVKIDVTDVSIHYLKRELLEQVHTCHLRLFPYVTDKLAIIRHALDYLPNIKTLVTWQVEGLLEVLETHLGITKVEPSTPELNALCARNQLRHATLVQLSTPEPSFERFYSILDSE